jgi:hypothetical protein
MPEHITSNKGSGSLAGRRKGLISGCSFMLTLLVVAPAVAQVPCPPQIFGTQGEECAAIPPQPTQQSSTPDYQDPLAACSGLQARRVVSVATASALQDAMTNASCGDTIQLAGGSYGSDLALSKSCPADNPVIVKGAANFASVATGRWTLTGARNIVADIQFSGSSSGVNCRGTNNKILGNRFTGTARNAIQLSAAASPAVACEVAYNEIYSPTATCDTFRQAIKMNTGGSGQSATAQKDIWIHHNYIHDWPGGCKQADVIEIGESGNYDWVPTLKLGMYLEDNLIERHTNTGQASFDIKIGGNVVRRNTLSDVTNMRIQGRQGIGSIWEGNWIESGALMVNNTDNIVACNYVRGQNIRVIAGTYEYNALGNGYPRARNTLVAGNDGPLLVGHQYNENHTYHAQNTTIEDHTGPISFGLHTGTVNNSVESSSYMCPAAVKLSPSQVGPAALGQAPASYLMCRRP